MAASEDRSTTHVFTSVPAPSTTAGASGLEARLAETLAGVVRSERVPADSDFFDDLGADSLVMAQFCARVRKRDDLPAVSMKDIYRHRTIRDLAAALAEPGPGAGNGPPAPVSSPLDTVVPARAGTAAYVLCGVAQLLLFFGYVYGTAVVVGLGYDWIGAGSGLWESYLRAVV
ncbi:acyl carrier protein, partial [Streptomyces minutiscleroticus]|uniref:acyl carrier protein n=1 Tax=Streptomyces minutiscleroticus TaxID=68238 RepID=UPI001E2C1FEC